MARKPVRALYIYVRMCFQMVEHDAVMMSEMLQQSQAVEESSSGGSRKRGGRRADKKVGGKKGAQEASKYMGKAELQFMSVEEV